MLSKCGSHQKLAGKWLRHLQCDKLVCQTILNHFSTISCKIFNGAHIETALATVICIYYSHLSYITQGTPQLSWKQPEIWIFQKSAFHKLIAWAHISSFNQFQILILKSCIFGQSDQPPSHALLWGCRKYILEGDMYLVDENKLYNVIWHFSVEPYFQQPLCRAGRKKLSTKTGPLARDVGAQIISVSSHLQSIWILPGERNRRGIKKWKGLPHPCSSYRHNVAIAFQDSLTSDVPAPAWGQRPGQARPKKAGPNQACRFGLDSFWPGLDIWKAWAAGLSHGLEALWLNF